jgi:hypothetical protein
MPPPDRAQARLAAQALGVDLDDAGSRAAGRSVAAAALERHLQPDRGARPAAMWASMCWTAWPRCHRCADICNMRPAGGTAARILDVGSGGGLPGVVWAVALPEADIVCVDTVGKKAAFVRQVAGALACPTCRHGMRASSSWPSPFDLITSRAFASLADFTRLTRRAGAGGPGWR